MVAGGGGGSCSAVGRPGAGAGDPGRWSCRSLGFWAVGLGLGLSLGDGLGKVLLSGGCDSGPLFILCPINFLRLRSSVPRSSSLASPAALQLSNAFGTSSLSP